MDFPIQISAIRIGVSNIYFKGSQVDFSKESCTSFSEDCIYHSKQNMIRWACTVCKSAPLWVSSIHMANYILAMHMLLAKITSNLLYFEHSLKHDSKNHTMRHSLNIIRTIFSAHYRNCSLLCEIEKTS